MFSPPTSALPGTAPETWLLPPRNNGLAVIHLELNRKLLCRRDADADLPSHLYAARVLNTGQAAPART